MSCEIHQQCGTTCEGLKKLNKEMLRFLYGYKHLFETYVMQDMELEQLKTELDPAVYADVVRQRKRIYAVIAKAERRSK